MSRGGPPRGVEPHELSIAARRSGHRTHSSHWRAHPNCRIVCEWVGRVTLGYARNPSANRTSDFEGLY